MSANSGAALRTTRAPRKRTASAQWWHRVHAQRGAAKGVAWQFAGQVEACVRSRALSRSQASHWLLNFVRQSWRTTGTAAECKDHGVHVFRLYRSQLNSCAVSIGCSNSLPVKALLFPRIVALFFCFNSLCEIQIFNKIWLRCRHRHTCLHNCGMVVTITNVVICATVWYTWVDSHSSKS